MSTKPFEEYFTAVADDRKEAMANLRAQIEANLPAGFEPAMTHGMPSWVVPHSLYPDGYHVNPELPLPFLSLASQRSHIAIYHMGLYADPALMEWFVGEYPGHSRLKLNMGKSCIRFKNPKRVPFDLIGQLCSRMTPDRWVSIYEKQVRP